MPYYAKLDKDPDATLVYGFDWVDWLNGDTIATSTWVVPSGLTLVSDSNTTTQATAKISGGTLGYTYDVVNRITTTTTAETEDRTLRLHVKTR